MIYQPATGDFVASECRSLLHARGFLDLYGWIEGFGTPPEPHWDCILLSDGSFELGDRIEIEIVGVFFRKDGDHKFVAVEKGRSVSDFEELTDCEKDALHRLYPRAEDGEGWFGRETAAWCMEHCQESL